MLILFANMGKIPKKIYRTKNKNKNKEEHKNPQMPAHDSEAPRSYMVFVIPQNLSFIFHFSSDSQFKIHLRT